MQTWESVGRALLIAAIIMLVGVASSTIPPTEQIYCQVADSKPQWLQPGSTIWMNTGETLKVISSHDIRGFYWVVSNLCSLRPRDKGIKCDSKASAVTLLDQNDHEIQVTFSGIILPRGFRFWIGSTTNHSVDYLYYTEPSTR